MALNSHVLQPSTRPDHLRPSFSRLLAALVAGSICASAAAKPTHHIEVGNVNLDVSIDRQIHSDRSGYPWTDWLENTLRATQSVTGDFPQERVSILLEATSRGSDAIAFGQVRRSRPPQIRFYVDPRAGLDDLNRDWRGYHEFAHLLIPFPGNDDIWFSEGLASYYQYLLQSRAGVVGPERAWKNLLAGFKRGLDDRQGRGQTLRQLSPDMWRLRAFRRVYWTGAAFFLRVDTRLRDETGGRVSLDTTLAAFHECCMERRRRWSARELVERFGQLSVPEIWRQEYRATIDSPADPVYHDALERLGIVESALGARFSDAADQARMRDRIAGPLSEDPESPLHVVDAPVPGDQSPSSDAAPEEAAP